MNVAKQIIKLALEKAGYEIRRGNGARSAFLEQARLISRTAEPIIIDCGAHIGETVLQYRRLIPKAKIIAFEPFPEAFKQLRENTRTDRRVKVFRKAVLNKSGQITLNCNLLPQTNSLLESDPRGEAYWGKGLLDTRKRIRVDGISLDDFCTEQQVDRVDILKLDIQGAEYLALEGASALLETQRISLIYSEVLMMPTYKGQRKFWELLELLDKFNYELFNFYHPHERWGQLIQSDMLFISKQFKLSLAPPQNLNS